MTTPITQEDRDELTALGIPADIVITNADFFERIYSYAQNYTLDVDSVRAAAVMQHAKPLHVLLEEPGDGPAIVTVHASDQVVRDYIRSRVYRIDPRLTTWLIDGDDVSVWLSIDCLAFPKEDYMDQW